MKRGKFKNKHCSAMPTSAWCDLNSKGDTLKIHDICHNPKGKCQKQNTFAPKQLQLEGARFKNTMKKIFRGTEKMWNNFIKPGLKTATPIISAGVAAKLKNAKAVERRVKF